MKINSEKKICVVQMNHTDITPHLEKYNSIIKIKKSKIFNHIVIAAPDIKENKILNTFAKNLGVDIFFGDVNNVTKRIYDVAKKYKCTIIARVLPIWFFIDESLIADMVNFIDKNESLDYVNLPENFDIRFGADVFRLCFLKKILDEFKEDKNKEIKFRFNPWGYAELYPEKFNMITFKDVPVYDKKRFKETKDLVAKVWPDRFDHSSNPIFPYHQARQFLDDQKIALDVACGLGSGSVYLAEHAKKVLGIDISEEAIAHCKKKYEDLRNVEFIKKDIYDLNFDSGYFDLIISIHTLEHLPDEKGFLNRVHYWLKPGGIVIIEVPLKKESPFKGIVEPFRKGHIREYESQEFIKLLNDYFIIEKSFGVVRNFYAEIKKARDSVMIIARKK